MIEIFGRKTARICIAGVSVPRGQISESISTLPSARAISEALIADLNRPSPDFTLMLMQWGQFLDHDITHTPLTRGERMKWITHPNPALLFPCM